MPIAKVRCASGESAPKDMAVEMKRRRIVSAGSTSSSGIGVPERIASKSRGLAGTRAATRARNVSYAWGVFASTAFCIARTRGGDQP